MRGSVRAKESKVLRMARRLEADPFDDTRLQELVQAVVELKEADKQMIEGLSKDRLVSLTAAALANTVKTHGPIGLEQVHSAAKRVVGQFVGYLNDAEANSRTR